MLTRKNDKGLKNILSSLEEANGKGLKVGIFANAKARRSSVPGSPANSLAFRYAIHDQGYGVPQRETLKPAIERAISKDPIVSTFLSHGLQKGGFKKKVNRAGLRIVANVKKEITDLRTPPKKQSTIEAARRRYGGNARNNPLIQTSEMRNAITFRYVR